ncbi:MAG: hypothetical protein ABRQ39_31990 [Candidatus Eremiobacterota bacterium]
MKTNNVGIEELKKNAPPFHAIIPGILVSIPCGFILSITITDTMMYHNPYHNLYPLIFPFCNILFSLILGIAISYGIKRKKYGNKRNIFILIVFCSFLIYFFISIIFMYILFKTGYAGGGLLALLKSNVHMFRFNEYVEFFLWVLRIWPLRYFEGLWLYTGIMARSELQWELLAAMVNILLWFIQFFITIFFTWKYIIYTCPWLSEVSEIVNSLRQIPI